MMTQTQFDGNDCSSAHALQLFRYDENTLAQNSDGPQKRCSLKPEIRLVENSPENPELLDSVTSEMFLWPSLAKIRSTIARGSSVQKELAQAMSFRSLFISTAVLSMTFLGMMV